jgi:glycosyltransferase involved in cell wall biosynthesis
VFQVPNDRYRSQNARIWLAVAKLITPLTSYSRLAEKIQDWLSWRGQRQRLLNIQAGYEDFDFPGTSRILALTPEQADILHLHNLHGNYFDLSQLPDFCGHLPVFITMHDAWLLSGHCAHSFDCNLWQRGCGNCPDLTIYPSLTRDQTAFCWQRKEAIYAHSDIYLATPCNWLMSRVKQSMLWQSVRDARVIPYGVDLTVFNESERQFAKRRLRIPEGGIVLLFVSHGIRQNPWKDYQTLRRAIEQISQMYPSKEITFLALGETSKEEKIGMARIRFIPYTTDVSVVARYYCAADVYVHAAHQDTFPNTILEALACGTPVVATAVGGIPEQIRDGVTGLLTPAGDPESLARSIVRLIQDQDLRTRMSHNAAEYARKYFNIERQADDYLKWYYQVLTNNDSSMIDE